MIAIKLFFIFLFLQITAFLFWILKIRTYLRENGLNTLKGVSLGATAFNDVQQLMELSRKKGEWPTLLTVFFVIEGASLASFALAIMLNIK
jgi:uncharacterized membrane protein